MNTKQYYQLAYKIVKKHNTAHLGQCYQILADLGVPYFVAIRVINAAHINEFDLLRESWYSKGTNQYFKTQHKLSWLKSDTFKHMVRLSMRWTYAPPYCKNYLTWLAHVN